MHDKHEKQCMFKTVKRAKIKLDKHKQHNNKNTVQQTFLAKKRQKNKA
jgi:hypothetical protein